MSLGILSRRLRLDVLLCLLSGSLTAGCNSFEVLDEGGVRVRSLDYQPQVMVGDNLKVDETVGFSIMVMEEKDIGVIWSLRTSKSPDHLSSWADLAHRTGMYEQYYSSVGLGLTYGLVVRGDTGFGLYAVYEKKTMHTYAEMTRGSSEPDFLTDLGDSEQDGINIGVIGWRNGMGYSLVYDNYLESFIFGLVL